MVTYLAFLRGINVGGQSLIKMNALRDALSKELTDVRTYIQSGNVIFESDSKDKKQLAKIIRGSIQRHFKLDVAVAIFSAKEWQKVITDKPAWWGVDPTWKHNLLILTDDTTPQVTIAAIGELKPGIEKVAAGQGVVYQSILFEKFGRTTSGKLASNPIYKKMTIRNYNTTTKLLNLVD